MGGAPVSKKLLPTCLKSVFCLSTETEGQRKQSRWGLRKGPPVLREEERKD